jgi:hypothetical protein
MTALIFMAVFLSSPPADGYRVPQEAGPSLKIDILVRRPTEQCPIPNGDEIVVCAREKDNEMHRLRPIADTARYEKDETKAEFNLSENVRMAAEVDSNQLAGGVTSKSIMARVKIKF